MDFKSEITRLKRIVHFLNRTSATIIDEIITTLSGLTDVTIYEPSEGDVLTYDEGTGTWINAPAQQPTQEGSGFTSYAYAVWSGTGLIFDVIHSSYYINGVLYPRGYGQITLDTADATFNRLDVIAVDATGRIKITGTPSADPVKPTVDTLTQLEITFILVEAGATTPTEITDLVIYKQNVEFTGSSNISGINFASTVDPFAGTLCINVPSFTNGQHIRFTGTTTYDISDYNFIKLYIKLKNTFASTAGFQVAFKNSTTYISSVFTVTHGVYQFDRFDVTGYQLIVIPLTEFTFSSAIFNIVEILTKGSNLSGFRADNIVLQGGITGTSSLQNALVTIQTPSGNAISDQPNDTFVFEGANISALGKKISFLTRLDGLIDVDIYEATNGDVLTYQGGTWYALPPTGGGSGTGLQDLYIPATAMWPRTTGGCAALAKTEIATSLVNIQSLDFDQSTEENAQFTISLPRNWNNGTVTVKFYWTAASGSGDVIWGIAGGAYSNDDALSTALGTAQEVTDTLITANDLHITSATSALTLAGTPADADFLAFNIYRKAANGSDTLTADAKLLGIVITLTTDAGVAA